MSNRALLVFVWSDVKGKLVAHSGLGTDSANSWTKGASNVEARGEKC